MKYSTVSNTFFFFKKKKTSPSVTLEREKENCALKPYTNLQLQYQDWDARQGQDRKTEDRKLEMVPRSLRLGKKYLKRTHYKSSRTSNDPK